MSMSANGDSALHELARAMTASGCHSTAITLRKLAYEGYKTLEEVDSATDWVLLSIRGMGAKRLSAVRRLTRRDWKAPSASAIQTANWFLSAARFALRYWPSQTLVSLIRGSAPGVADEGPIDRRLAIDVFAQAVHQALRHCEAEDLIQSLHMAGETPSGRAWLVPTGPSNHGMPLHASGNGHGQPSAAGASPTLLPEGDHTAESDHYAYPFQKRRQIVRHFRMARARGEVQNKDAWAQTNYSISGRTLFNYEREFPETGQDV